MATLLIVDDDEAIREALCELFEGEHLCHTAGTAEEALTLLGAHAYDVVVTDISMPGMSGEDLLRFVRIYQPRTPVVFISGSIERRQAEGLKSKGAFGYLLKPFRLEDIEGSVTQAIEYRRRILDEHQRTAGSGSTGANDAGERAIDE
jgi:DNA-binding NtrC family response regulator